MAPPGVKVIDPVDVVSAKDLTITEYFGRVASEHTECSACVATIRGASEEAFQTPDFDEYVLILEGEVRYRWSDGSEMTVGAGKGVFLPKGTRVKWIWPGPCKYVPICLPAFSPMNCAREEEENCAKDAAAMAKLRELHKNAAADKKPWSFGMGALAGATAALVLAHFIGGNCPFHPRK